MRLANAEACAAALATTARARQSQMLAADARDAVRAAAETLGVELAGPEEVSALTGEEVANAAQLAQFEKGGTRNASRHAQFVLDHMLAVWPPDVVRVTAADTTHRHICTTTLEQLKGFIPPCAFRAHTLRGGDNLISAEIFGLR
eukprot:gnl/Chilomastix_cuspidata/8518.p2 GENE.gnl/Chilomastix_cuspidata/8518~~gnl/Chilomastix_cuspidata/8518.p2  ORF type:complete len:145 (+),score=18.55 gnl/Chilomastix_cuspidata/8518:408-842(+)